MKKKILVVDDDEEIRALLEDILEATGFKVDCASCKTEMEAKLLSFKPDLMILDIMLGDVNAADWVAAHALSETHRNLPILFLSGLLGDGTPAPAKPGHRMALRGKPFQIDALLQDVHCLLDLS